VEFGVTVEVEFGLLVILGVRRRVKHWGLLGSGRHFLREVSCRWLCGSYIITTLSLSNNNTSTLTWHFMAFKLLMCLSFHCISKDYEISSLYEELPIKSSQTSTG